MVPEFLGAFQSNRPISISQLHPLDCVTLEKSLPSLESQFSPLYMENGTTPASFKVPWCSKAHARLMACGRYSLTMLSLLFPFWLLSSALFSMVHFNILWPRAPSLLLEVSPSKLRSELQTACSGGKKPGLAVRKPGLVCLCHWKVLIWYVVSKKLWSWPTSFSPVGLGSSSVQW